MTNNFQTQLAYGQEFEKKAQRILIKQFEGNYVISTRFSSNHGQSDLDPRAFSTNDDLVLPDFMILGYKSVPIWVDAKRKSNFFPHNNRNATSLDPKFWGKCKKLSDKLGEEIWIIMGIDTIPGIIYFFEYDAVDDLRQFNNIHNDNPDEYTPVYYLDQLIQWRI